MGGVGEWVAHFIRVISWEVASKGEGGGWRIEGKDNNKQEGKEQRC